MHTKKKTDCVVGLVGGTQQIRTAVDGFADRCLTTRPGYHIWEGKGRKKNQLAKLLILLMRIPPITSKSPAIVR